MRNRQRIIIEFTGAPGVGKSFLVAAVRDELIRRSIPVIECEAIGVSRSISGFLTIVAAMVSTLRLRPKTIATLPGFVTQLSRHRSKLNICRQRQCVCLFDHGFFQLLGTLYKNSNHERMTDLADRLIASCEAPDIVVIVTASTDKILSRRAHRQRHDDNPTLESVHRDLQLHDEIIATVAHVRRRVTRDVQTIAVSAETDDIDDNVTKVLGVIQSNRTAVQAKSSSIVTPL